MPVLVPVLVLMPMHIPRARELQYLVPVYYRWMDWVCNVVVMIGQMAGEKKKSNFVRG
jgi:hypothetical protein